MKATFLFNRPEVINEISFETKGPVENHILMAGDAAGMIAPLCGNGMAIAIRSAKMLSEAVIPFCDNKIGRREMEEHYRREWEGMFRFRLWFGRTIQRLLGHPKASAFAVKIARASPFVAEQIVRMTHGSPF